jgi:hypothetical protein
MIAECPCIAGCGLRAVAAIARSIETYTLCLFSTVEQAEQSCAIDSVAAIAGGELEE